MKAFKYQIETKITNDLWNNIEKDVLENTSIVLHMKNISKMYIPGQKNFFDIWSEISNKVGRLDRAIPIISRPASECPQTLKIIHNKTMLMWPMIAG